MLLCKTKCTDLSCPVEGSQLANWLDSFRSFARQLEERLLKLISSYCVIRKAAVLTLENVLSLKLIVPRFYRLWADESQLFRPVVCGSWASSRALWSTPTVSVSGNLSRRAAQESTARLDCKGASPNKILEPYPVCAHCHFCVRRADLGNQAAPSSPFPPNPHFSSLCTLVYIFAGLGIIPLAVCTQGQALLSCISSIHWVFKICFPNWKYSELVIEK